MFAPKLFFYCVRQTFWYYLGMNNAIATPVTGETVRILPAKYDKRCPFTGLVGEVVATSKDLSDLQIETKSGALFWISCRRVEFGR